MNAIPRPRSGCADALQPRRSAPLANCVRLSYFGVDKTPSVAACRDRTTVVEDFDMHLDAERVTVIGRRVAEIDRCGLRDDRRVQGLVCRAARRGVAP